MPARKPVIGMVMGDAAGIGPEIILSAFQNKGVAEAASHFVIGSMEVMERAARTIDKKVPFCRLESVKDLNSAGDRIGVLNAEEQRNPHFRWGVVDAINGSNSVAYMKKAVELALGNEIDAVVIAPLNKEAMHVSGFQYPDESAFLGDLTKTRAYGVPSWNNIFRMSVTAHIPLRQVADLVTKERIIPVIKRLSDTLSRMGIVSPRIGVAALNPHAGEGGAFGDEEIREIAPAVCSAQEMGILASGPYPADTIFVRAMKGEIQGVVFLYHDQGNIAMKTAAFGKSVLVYAGLPFPCTGTAHGTAYEIAGQAKADPTSFELALKLARQMVSRGCVLSTTEQ